MMKQKEFPLPVCDKCGFDIFMKEKKDVILKMDNPGEIVISDQECFSCQKCGEMYFTEKQSNELAKKIEKREFKILEAKA